jgi:hypothetical protein
MSRFLLALPLLGIIALWAFSMQRYDIFHTKVGHQQLTMISTDGRLQFETRTLDVYDNTPFVAEHRMDVPYWVVWLIAAGATISIGIGTSLRRKLPAS